jgi:hypothetical protein
MYVAILTYAMGGLSLGLSGTLLWHLNIGFNTPTCIVASLTAGTLYLLAKAHKLNGVR